MHARASTQRGTIIDVFREMRAYLCVPVMACAQKWFKNANVRGPPSDRNHQDVKQRDKPAVKGGEEAGGDKGPSASDGRDPAFCVRNSDGGSRDSRADLDVAGSTGLGVGGGAGMGGGGAGRGGEAARGPVQRERGKETEVPDLGMVGAKLRKEFVQHGVFQGVITEARHVPNDQGSLSVYYRVVYEDGDEEDLNEEQVRPLLTSAPSAAPKKSPIAHHDMTLPASASPALVARSAGLRSGGLGKKQDKDKANEQGQTPTGATGIARRKTATAISAARVERAPVHPQVPAALPVAARSTGKRKVQSVEREGSVRGISGDRDGGKAAKDKARMTSDGGREADKDKAEKQQGVGAAGSMRLAAGGRHLAADGPKADKDKAKKDRESGTADGRRVDEDKAKKDREGARADGRSARADGRKADTDKALSVAAGELRWKQRHILTSGDRKKDREMMLWSSKFERLRQFQLKHGHVQVKKSSSDNQDLYWWLKVVKTLVVKTLVVKTLDTRH